MKRDRFDGTHHSPRLVIHCYSGQTENGTGRINISLTSGRLTVDVIWIRFGRLFASALRKCLLKLYIMRWKTKSNLYLVLQQKINSYIEKIDRNWNVIMSYYCYIVNATNLNGNVNQCLFIYWSIVCFVGTNWHSHCSIILYYSLKLAQFPGDKPSEHVCGVKFLKTIAAQ